MMTLGEVMVTLLLTVVTALVILYLSLKRKQKKIRLLGVPGPESSTLLGSLKEYKNKGVALYDLELMKKYGNKVRTPLNFKGEVGMERSHMQDVCHSVLDYGCPLQKAVAVTSHQEWKHLRSHLSPLFTKDRLQKLLPELEECVQEFIDKLSGKMTLKSPFDIQNLCGLYTLDCLLSTIFGYDMHSCKSPNESLIYQCIQSWRAGNESIKPKAALCLVAPFMRNVLKTRGFNVLPADVRNYFQKLITKEIHKRHSKETKSDDFVQWMIDTQNNQANGHCVNNNKEPVQHGLTEEEIVANCIFFIMAGYDTMANLLGFVLYNVASCPHVQEKLYGEIKNNLNQSISMEAIDSMRYLENVVNETLRLTPPFLRVNRVASHDITVHGVHIPEGTDVHVPLYALHRDPNVWPNPEQFDPDRFAKEISELSFLPFGVGPRDCFPKTMAVLVVKLAVIKIIQQDLFYWTNQGFVNRQRDTKSHLTYENDDPWSYSKGRVQCRGHLMGNQVFYKQTLYWSIRLLWNDNNRFTENESPEICKDKIRPDVFFRKKIWYKNDQICSKCVHYRVADLRTPLGETPIAIYDAEDDIYVSTALKSRGTYEPDKLHLMYEIFKKYPDVNVIDVGSNLGIFSLYAAKLGRKALAIEALSINVQRICHSIMAGDFQNSVYVVHNAVSDNHEKVKLGAEIYNVGGTYVEQNASYVKELKHGRAKGTYGYVNTITMDDLLNLTVINDFKKVFIKIDIEGFEHRAINRSHKLFEKLEIVGILMEWYFHKGRPSSEPILKFMEDHGFKAHFANPFMSRLNMDEIMAYNVRDILWLPQK
ncbi:hypothetical protein FSP39_023906 [Pinctada imbricata]|uniref:Methyltransferase FkbM domain-containing protein n=1 Tax=Pinctada imbricata TaxID=66713 RepID=A0AA88YG48_PINIB|nr:hypothetical protein FSP39_023906 [Pinctada imbricata]